MSAIANFLFIRLINWSCCFLFISLGVIVTVQIIWRYILRLPLPWVDELARYLFIWLSFFGAALAVKKGAHMGVNLLLKMAPPNIRFILQMIIFGLMFALCFIILIWGSRLVIHSMPRFAPTLQIPMGYVYLALPVSAFFMIYYLGVDLIGLFKGRIADQGKGAIL